MTNYIDGTVSAYKVESDGVLKAIAGSPVFSGGRPYGLVVDSTDSFLYVANYHDNTISGFSITKTGSLTPIAGSPFATAAGPYSIAVAP